MTGHQIRLFVERSGAGVNWRLLAPNNREVGRGARAFPDEARCRAALLELRGAGDRLAHQSRRASAGGWTWDLRLDGEIVATSARPFDRLIRCQQVLAVVVARLLDAPLSPSSPAATVRRRREIDSFRPIGSVPAGVDAAASSGIVHPRSDRYPKRGGLSLSTSRSARPRTDLRPTNPHREIA